MIQLSLLRDDNPLLPQVHGRLLAAYGPQRDQRRLDPTSQFVQVMLSPRTLDTVSVPAFLRLRARFRSWEELPEADPEDILPIIRPVTYAEDKARNLVAAAAMIREKRGSVDLGFLADWPLQEALSWLLALPGAGLRAAATILNFSALRKRVFAVDTHVLRLSQRIGVVAGSADLRACFAAAMESMPDDWEADDLYELHWLMKLHGQKVCRYEWIDCGNCPLRELCAFHRNGTR
jgi:endonuclease-3